MCTCFSALETEELRTCFPCLDDLGACGCTSCFALAFLRLEVVGASSSTSCCTLALPRLKAEGAGCSTRCFALAFFALTLWELDARPGALHLLFVLTLFGSLLLYQVPCTCFPYSDSLGACCSTSCSFRISHFLTPWELFALPLGYKLVFPRFQSVSYRNSNSRGV